MPKESERAKLLRYGYKLSMDRKRMTRCTCIFGEAVVGFVVVGSLALGVVLSLRGGMFRGYLLGWFQAGYFGKHSRQFLWNAKTLLDDYPDQRGDQ